MAGLSEAELFRAYGLPYLPIRRFDEGTEDMPFISVSSGGTTDIDEGVYEVVLAKISDPKTVLAARGPKAGQEIDLLDWTFVIVNGPHKDKELVASTSTASGPKSKMYAYLTALFNGRPPAIGQSFEREDLVGRGALATVTIDDGGWARISNLGAMPASMLGRNVAAQTGAPTQGTPPRRNAPPLNLEPASVAAADDLPF